MASNPTPEDGDTLKALAEDLADGCHLHEVAIGIKQNTEAVIRAAISTLEATELARANAETDVGNKNTAHQTRDNEGFQVLKNCRLRLAKLFGNFFNSQWQAAGWPTGTTAIPTTLNGRFSLLSSLKLYFTNNPASESADMEATAAICTTAHTNLSNARAALNQAKNDLKDAKDAGEGALRNLKKRVRGLIDELGTLLPDDDTRYLAFGLNIPASPSAPEAIETLTAAPAGAGKIHLTWSYATRLAGTRLLTKRTTGPEIDPEFVNQGTTGGLEKTVGGFEPGAIVLVKVVPYNDGGDGPESPTVSVTVT